MTSIIIFEAVACVLLGTMLASRWLFRQPLDRIRIVQIGFGCIVLAAVCIACGIGPTWTIALPHLAGTPGKEPVDEQSRNLQIAEERNPLGLHLSVEKT